MQFFNVPESILPVQQRPSLVLSAEAELGITAGLQDRVIQVKLALGWSKPATVLSHYSSGSRRAGGTTHQLSKLEEKASGGCCCCCSISLPLK